MGPLDLAGDGGCSSSGSSARGRRKRMNEREEEGDKAHRWDKNALERSERIADGRHMESLALLPVAAWAVVRAQWKNRNLV